MCFSVSLDTDLQFKAGMKQDERMSDGGSKAGREADREDRGL